MFRLCLGWRVGAGTNGIYYDSAKRRRLVALTANAMKGDEKKCLEAGCDDYLAKPIEREKLFEMLDKYLSPTFEEKDCSVAGKIDVVTKTQKYCEPTIR